MGTTYSGTPIWDPEFYMPRTNPRFLGGFFVNRGKLFSKKLGNTQHWLLEWLVHVLGESQHLIPQRVISCIAMENQHLNRKIMVNQRTEWPFSIADGSVSSAPSINQAETYSINMCLFPVHGVIIQSPIKIRVRNCFGFLFSFWDFFLDLLFCPLSFLFEAFWS